VLNHFVAYIRILRPLNCIFVIFAVLFGVYYKNAAHSIFFPLVAGIAAALVSGGGYVINDFYDHPIDLINKNNRVLPSGLIEPARAKKYAFSLFLSGILICIFFQNPWMISLAISNSLLLYIYAMKGKHIHFWGNLMVAFITATTFIFGSLLTNNVTNALFLAICAFFYTTIREMVKDIVDKKGDSIEKAKTLPLLIGDKKTLFLSLIFWIGLTATLIIGYPKFYSEFIMGILLIIISLFLLIDLLALLVNTTRKRASYSVMFMKTHMFIFLIILWMVQ